MNGLNEILDYAVDPNLLVEIINTIKYNTHIHLQATKDICLQLNNIKLIYKHDSKTESATHS